MNFKEFYDISYPLSKESVVFPGDPPFEAKAIAGIPEKGYAMSILKMSSHLGTHIDPPAHILEGKETIDQLSLDAFAGDCRVIKVDDYQGKICPENIKSKIRLGDRILFKTRNSELMQLKEFREDYVYIAKETAYYLAGAGVKLVGLDYFTIDSFTDENFTAHKILLSQGIPILEGIDLSKVEEGEYTLVCFPLKIAGGDGSPTRAVLLR